MKKNWGEQKRILDIGKISAKNYILTVQEKQRALRGIDGIYPFSITTK